MLSKLLFARLIVIFVLGSFSRNRVKIRTNCPPRCRDDTGRDCANADGNLSSFQRSLAFVIARRSRYSDLVVELR